MIKPYVMPTKDGSFAAVVPSPEWKYQEDPDRWPAVRLLYGTRANALQVALTPFEAIRLADALVDAAESIDPERTT